MYHVIKFRTIPQSVIRSRGIITFAFTKFLPAKKGDSVVLKYLASLSESWEDFYQSEICAIEWYRSLALDCFRYRISLYYIMKKRNINKPISYPECIKFVTRMPHY